MDYFTASVTSRISYINSVGGGGIQAGSNVFIPIFIASSTCSGTDGQHFQSIASPVGRAVATSCNNATNKYASFLVSPNFPPPLSAVESPEGVQTYQNVPQISLIEKPRCLR